MKRKFFKSILTLTALVLVTSVPGQHNETEPGNRHPSKTIIKEAPAGWEKSIKEIVFYEDFSAGMDAWTAVGAGVDNWYLSEINLAGGAPPEAFLDGYPAFTGASRLVSPVINTTGYADIVLSFLHCIYTYSSSPIWFSVETTSDGGTTWNTAWEMESTSAGNYAALEAFSVTTPDLGSANFQFCFKFSDDSYDLGYWAIDNVTLGDAINYDVTPTALMGLENALYGGDLVNISSIVNNYGAQTVSFDVKMEINDGSNVVFTSTKSITNLAFGELVTVDFDPWTAVIGNFTATVTTLLTGDENPENDMISEEFPVYDPNYYCIPSAYCSFGDGLNDFAFAGIENYGSGCSNNGYGNFTSLEGIVEIGNDYVATISTKYTNQFVSIWVDFNKDIEFSADELILADFNLSDSGVLYDVPITIPGFGITGTTVMRVGANWAAPCSTDPCADLIFGEWEDYTIIVTGSQIIYNAGVVSINMNSYEPQGIVIPKATVINLGAQTVSFPVTCTIDDVYSSTVNVTNLALLDEIEVEFEAWTATSGSYNVEVQTELSGDENPENDVLTKQIGIVPFIPPKKVFAEEATGTWCGFCVRGTCSMAYMEDTYPDTWIGVAVHNYDPMVVPEYDAEIPSIIPNFAGYPSGTLDRAGENAWDPSEFEQGYLERMAAISPVVIDIVNFTWDPVTRVVSFDLRAISVVEISNELRFCAVMAEDSLWGTTSGWNQSNYYAGGGMGQMCGFEVLPNPVPAADMHYDHVARAILDTPYGTPGSLPSPVLAGTEYFYNYSYTLPDEWIYEKMHFIGLVIDMSSGEVLNCNDVINFGTGSNEVLSLGDIRIYPNPAKDEVRISNIEQGNIYFYNINGQLVMEKQNVKGDCRIDISNFENGTYILKIISDKETNTTKVNVIK